MIQTSAAQCVAWRKGFFDGILNQDSSFTNKNAGHDVEPGSPKGDATVVVKEAIVPITPQCPAPLSYYAPLAAKTFRWLYTEQKNHTSSNDSDLSTTPTEEYCQTLTYGFTKHCE